LSRPVTGATGTAVIGTARRTGIAAIITSQGSASTSGRGGITIGATGVTNDCPHKHAVFNLAALFHERSSFPGRRHTSQALYPSPDTTKLITALASGASRRWKEAACRLVFGAEPACLPWTLFHVFSDARPAIIATSAGMTRNQVGRGREQPDAQSVTRAPPAAVFVVQDAQQASCALRAVSCRCLIVGIASSALRGAEGPATWKTPEGGTLHGNMGRPYGLCA
jgi:hypothetical protein